MAPVFAPRVLGELGMAGVGSKGRVGSAVAALRASGLDAAGFRASIFGPLAELPDGRFAEPSSVSGGSSGAGMLCGPP